MIYSYFDARFLLTLAVNMATLRPVRRRGDSCPHKSNRVMACSPISYPVSIGLFSIGMIRSVEAHLAHVTARFAANLACLATVP